MQIQKKKMATDTIILKIKDKKKISFLVKLLEQLGFVDFAYNPGKKTNSKHDFFKSAGFLENRNLNARELREQAWSRNR